MSWSLDARIPVRLGAANPAEEDAAFLVEGVPGVAERPAEGFTPEVSGHAPGCSCCAARSPAALALDRLFQRRARGEVTFFRRVIAVTSSPEGDMAVHAALQNDPVASARFRLDPGQPGTS